MVLKTETQDPREWEQYSERIFTMLKNYWMSLQKTKSHIILKQSIHFPLYANYAFHWTKDRLSRKTQHG